jgi:hypothetical protein
MIPGNLRMHATATFARTTMPAVTVRSFSILTE